VEKNSRATARVYVGEVTSQLCGHSQHDLHFVGQHVVLYVVKWWKFVALFV